MPFLTQDEFIELYSVQNTILNADERKWFMDECGKIETKTGYAICRRASSVSALRMYLMAEKNFTIEQVTDLDKLPKAELLQHMRDFIQYYNAPESTPEQLIEKIGTVYGKAYDKVVNSTIPDPGEIRSVDDFAKIQKQMNTVGLMYIDSDQDMESILGAAGRNQQHKDIFYNAAGGRKKYENNLHRWSFFSRSFTDFYKKMFAEEDCGLTVRAFVFDYSRKFFKKCRGMKLSQLPSRENYIYVGMFNSVTQEAGEGPFEPDLRQQTEAFLKGQAQNYPGQVYIEELVEDGIKANYASIMAKIDTDSNVLSNNIMDGYVRGLLNNNQKNLKDLTLLPEAVKRKMVSAYDKTFGKLYDTDAMTFINDYGKDQWDMIKGSDGQSIRQKAGDTYVQYDSAKQEEAMKLETIRALALESKGLKYQYVRVKGDGKLELTKPINLDRIPATFAIPIDFNFDRKTADAVFTDPQLGGSIITNAGRLYRKISSSIVNQPEILGKYGLTMADCFFVGDKSLRQLCDEMYPNKEEFAEEDIYKFLLAASLRDEPVFMTVVTEEKGELVRHVVPIVYTGRNVKNTKVKEISANRKAGEKVIAKLPKARLRKPIRTVNLQDITLEDAKLYPTENYFGMIVSMFGAEQVKVNELISHNTYRVRKFDEYAANMDSGNFTNEEFALLSYFAAMDPNSVKGDPWPQVGNEATHEEKMFIRHSFFTTDICVESHFPRENYWNNFYNPAIKDARESTEAAIAQYEEGNISPLASIISAGIKMSCSDLKRAMDISKTDALAAQIVAMLERMDSFLTSNGDPKLREAVENSLSAEEKRLFELGLQIRKLHKGKLEADELLSKAQKQEIVLTEEERQECTDYLARYAAITTAWKNNVEGCENAKYENPEFIRLTQEHATLMGEQNRLNKLLSDANEARKALKDLENETYGDYIINQQHYVTNEQNAEEMKQTLKELALSEKAYKKLKSDYNKANVKVSISNQKLFSFAPITITKEVGDDILKEDIKVSGIWREHNMNMFSAGKYGEVNGHKQLSDAQNSIVSLANILDPQLKDEYENLYAEINKEEFIRDVRNAPVTDSTLAVLSMAYTPKTNERVKNILKKIHDHVAEKLENPTDDMKPLLNYYKCLNAKLDTAKGNYTEAVYDNPYLYALNTLLVNDLSTNQYSIEQIMAGLGDKTDPTTGEKAPLCYILSYYESANEFFELEYERQRINVDYTPEKEADYLKRLEEAQEKFRDNMERFNAFNKTVVDKETGDSPYDIYFQNKLNSFTGTVLVGANGRRNTRRAQGWLKGRTQAIKNGWGMNELDVLGCVEYIDSTLQQAIEQYEMDNNPVKLTQTIEDKQKSLNTAKRQLTTLQKDLDTLQSNLAQENNPEVKNSIQEQIDFINGEISNKKARINDMTANIQDALVNRANYDNVIKEFRGMQNKLNAFKKEVYGRSVSSARDKEKVALKVRQFVDRFEQFAGKYGLADAMKSCKARLSHCLADIKRKVADNTKDPFMGRTTQPIGLDLMDEQYMETQQYELTFKDTLVNVDTIIKKNLPLYNKIYTDFNEFGKDVKNLLHMGYDDDDFVNDTKQGLANDPICKISVDGKVAPQYVKGLSKLTEEIYDCVKADMEALPAGEKIFRPLYDIYVNQLDVKNGNFLKALAENPCLRSLMGTTNYFPAIFREESNIAGYLSRDTVKHRLEERGILTPTVDYFAAVSQVLQIEYRKQKDMKEGWSKEKEQRYYFNLTNAYEKLIRSYEELIRFPENIQMAKSDAMEDSLGDIVNFDGDSARGISYLVGSMKWQLRAMKNGWHVDTLQAMGVYGRIDGNIETYTRCTEQKIKKLKEQLLDMPEGDEKNQEIERLRGLEQDLEDLRTFEREKMAPFRRRMLDKKIESPQDVLEAMNDADKFYADNKDLAIVTKFKLFRGTFEQNKSILDSVSNSVIEDIKLADKYPKLIQDKYTPVEIPVAHNGAEDIINFIPHEITVGGVTSKAEMRGADAVNIMAAAIKEQYLSTLYPDDYPRYFDKKHAGYVSAHKALDKEIKRYSKEYIEGLIPADTQFKDAMIKGPVLADILKYGHHSLFYSQLDNNVRIRTAKSAYSAFVEGELKGPMGQKTTLNEYLKAGLKKLNDAPEPITASNMLVEASDKLDEIIKLKKSIDKDLKKKHDLGQKCQADPKKLEELKNKVATFLVGVGGYITKKDALRKEKNGNLGKNGEARYEAMAEAYKCVRLLTQSIEMFDNQVILPSDYNWKPTAYGVDPKAELKTLEYRKSFIKEDLDKAMDKSGSLYEAEDKKREELMSEPEKNSKDIIRSAQRTIYLDYLKSAHNKEFTSAVKAEENLKHYNAAVNEYTKGKGESKNFKDFVKEALNDKDFNEEFSKKVLEGAKNGQLKTADILRYKNEAASKIMAARELQNQAQNKKQNQAGNQKEEQNKKNDAVKKS